MPKAGDSCVRFSEPHDSSTDGSARSAGPQTWSACARARYVWALEGLAPFEALAACEIETIEAFTAAFGRAGSAGAVRDREGAGVAWG